MGKLKKLGIGIGIFFAVIVALLVIAVVAVTIPDDQLRNPALTETQIKNSALEGISVQELLDNNDQYIDKIVHYEGKIIQISHQYNDVYILNVRVHDQDDDKENKVALKYLTDQEPKVFSTIDFYGAVKGTREMPALLTGQTLYFVDMDALLLNFTNTDGTLFDELK